MVMLALRQLEQARDNLQAVLATTPHEPRHEFAETLVAVRDSGLVDTTEAARWCGISRAQAYKLLAEHDQRR
jgi:hypothetical protein